MQVILLGLFVLKFSGYPACLVFIQEPVPADFLFNLKCNLLDQSELVCIEKTNRPTNARENVHVSATCIQLSH